MSKKRAVTVSDDQVNAKANDVNVIGIDERAVLVYLGISQWATSKKDKDLSSETSARLGAKDGEYAVTKTVMECKELDRLKACLGAMRKFHYEVVTRYGNDGWALLASKKIGEYKQEFTKWHDEFSVALPAFMAVYDDQIEKEKVRLAGGWKQTDYPPAAVVAAKYRMTCDMRRIRESQNSLLGVSDEITKQIADEADARIKAGLASSIKDIVERITEVIGAVAEVDSRERIHESIFENAKELAKVLPDLNITGDKSIDALADKILDKIGNVNAEDLKGKDDGAKEARKKVAEDAKSILDDLAGAF